jgi:hypothetical protein
MAQAIQGEYERREAAARGEHARMLSWSIGVRLVMAVAGVMAVASLWGMWGGRDAVSGAGTRLAAEVVVALAAGVVTLWLLERERRAWRVGMFYREGLGRLRGERFQPERTGEDFVEAGHLYERDLNVLGKDSLFSLLATTRTTIGQKGLAELLLRPAGAEEVRQRQAAVRELAGMLDLRERVGLLGGYVFKDVPLVRFEEWMEESPEPYPAWVRGVLAALTLGWMGLLVFGHWLPVDGSVERLVWFALVVAQGLVCLRLRDRVRGDLERVHRIVGQTEILREGLALLRGVGFTSERLVALQREALGEEKALARLQRYLVVVEQRAKEYVYPFGLLLCAGTRVVIALDGWRREFEGPMRRWIAAWAEFEGLMALATYTAEHDENVWPEVVDGAEPVFAVEGMVHPLLPRAEGVANDVSIGGGVRFLLISGSNMAGKSTLLRAIGANVVLGMAGAPLPVRSMKMTALRVGASLAVTDSLAEGKSKFLAEVERLRDVLELAKGAPGESLFLIDEIFSGTNSADRRAAAEAVLRGLVGAGAIGALSTHDLALAELAEMPELAGSNVHMASPDESDPLGFDYKLKVGVNRTTNALAIVRMLGLG